MRPMKFTAFRFAASAMLAILATACGGGGDGTGPGTQPPPPPPPAAVATVEVSLPSGELIPGGTAQLQAVARSSSGAALTDRPITWTTSSSAVATVSVSGLVTAVGDGTATITAAVEGRTGSATVTVRSPVATVTVTPGTSALQVGSAPVTLQAAMFSATGVSLPGRAVTWSSSNVLVATVTQAGVLTAVGPGTATITATSEGRSGTASVTVAAPDPCAAFRPIAIGGTFNGTLAPADCRLSDGTALQKFQLTIPTATPIEIEMRSSAVDSYLFLIDAGNQVVAENDDGGPGTDARIMRVLNAGTYTVVVNAYDPETYGAYSLTVRPGSAACFSARTATFPVGVNGQLSTTGSCRNDDDSYSDVYQFTLAARTNVAVDMKSGTVDSYLRVFDAQGQLVAQDDDGGPAGLDARAAGQLEAGTYFVMASARPNQVGTYRLDVTTAVDPCAVNRSVQIGQPVNGLLVTTDCTTSASGPTPYTQRYLLTVPATSALRVDMTSNMVDAYLVIQDATTGAVLAENDDAVQGNTDARISASFPAGQYVVNASTFDFGETGSFTLAVMAIPASGLTVSVSPGTVTLPAGGSQQVTATVSGSGMNAVTWTSSNPGVAAVTSTGNVRGVTAGTAVITARSTADPSRFADVQVTVTQNATGIANLDIASVYLVQSVQSLDGSVRLIAGRTAVARVFVRGSRIGMGSAPVRLRVYEGTTLLSTITGQGVTGTAVDQGCCSADIVIPGNLIRPGVSVLADVDPNNLTAEFNETDNLYPVGGVPQLLNVTSVPDFNIRIVPIRQNRTGQTGVATNSMTSILRALWPLGTVNATTRAALGVDYTLTGGSFDEWSFLVRDLELVRRAESSNMYYYGVVRVNYTSGVLGLAGGIPSLTVVGVDEGTPFGAKESAVTFAHEIGHAMGLRHAPCGGAAGPDPNYPHQGAVTNTFGMDVAAGNVIMPPTSTDIMSYCDNQWVSVYNYRNVMELRARNPNGVPAGLTGTAPASVLMVSGGVSGDRVTVDGAFALRALPSLDDRDGRLVLEGYDAAGARVFTHRFSPSPIQDGRPGDETFVVGVPMSGATAARVARVEVRDTKGTRRALRTRDARFGDGASLGAAFETTGATGAKALKWSTTAAPMVLVRDPGTGAVLAVGRTGTLSLEGITATEVELLVSDGVSSVRRLVNRVTGAIRQ